MGFAGLRFDEKNGEPTWVALVRNYHHEPVQREWFLASGNQRSTPQTIDLAPGEIRSLSGPFPKSEFCTLHLTADALTADDILPMARPKPRNLNLRAIVPENLANEATAISDSISDSRLIDDPADTRPTDILISTYNPIRPALPDENAIIVMEHHIKLDRVVTGRLIAEDEALISHLNWAPLIVRRSLQVPRRDVDKVLLWQDRFPLIMLRKEAGKQMLIFNFDLKGSNAVKLPAFIILIHRFAESIRRQKPALERRVLETGQPLDLRIPQGTEPSPFFLTFASSDGQHNFETEIPQENATQLTAPIYPGYLTIRHGEKLVLEAATHFADTREADLHRATDKNELAGMEQALVNRHSEQDVNWTIWILVLTLFLLSSWAWIAHRNALVHANDVATGTTSPAK